MYPYQKKLFEAMTKYKGRGVVQLTGRNMGKSYVNDILKNWYENMRPIPKIKWKRLPGTRLQAYTDDIQPKGFEVGLRETDMDPIQAWCGETHCGRRISFNEFQFKNEKQITMFLLRWGS